MLAFWHQSKKYLKAESEEILKFNKNLKTLDGKSLNIQVLRNNYLKSKDLPAWHRKIRNRNLFLKFSLPSLLLLYSYRKIERIIDYLEYGI